MDPQPDTSPLDDIPEDEQHPVPQPRKYPTFLIGVAVFAALSIGGAAIGVPLLNQAASPQPSAEATAQPTDPYGVNLYAHTESPTGSIVVTYADGSTETDDLVAWESSSFGTDVAPGETVTIEVRATSVGADLKHQKVSCAIKAAEPAGDPDNVEVYTSGKRHGIGAVTCTWTRPE